MSNTQMLTSILLIFFCIHSAFGLTFRCKIEILKYDKCIKDIQFNYDGGSEEIKRFCQHFQSEKCSSFRKDIEVTSTKCDYNNNVDDYTKAHKLFELKRNYLFFCSTYSESLHWECPLAKYAMRIADNNFSNYAYEIVEMNDMKIMLDEPEVLESNCRIPECNQKFLLLNDHIDFIHEMDYEIPSIYEEYRKKEIIRKYQKKTCFYIKSLESEYEEAYLNSDIKKMIKPYNITIVTILYLLFYLYLYIY